MRTRPGGDARSMRDDGMVCCAVGSQQYALRGADVRYIARIEHMRAVEGSDGSVGTLDIAGRTVPVFALGRMLDRPLDRRLDGACVDSLPLAQGKRASQSGHHIAVTGATSELVGWLVDHIVRTPMSEAIHVAPLPAIVGPVATAWFEAVVNVGDASMLLLAPHQLNPIARRQPPPAATPIFHTAASAAGPRSEPMVLIFTSSALPACGAPRYALSARQIAAVVQRLDPIVVPGSAPHVTGVAWWRGAVVPIIDYRARADREAAGPARRYIIARRAELSSDPLIAFAIDPDIALHKPEAGNREVTGVARPSFATGLFDVAGGTVALVDLEAMLDADRPELDALTA